MNDWIDSLRDSDKLIIVEGKKDLDSLKKLDINNVKAISEKPLYKFVEEVAQNHKAVIILTDLDKEGRKLYSILKHNLQRFGVKIDFYFREYLFRHSELAQIEGLPNYVKNK